MTLGGPDAASPLKQFTVAVTKWIGLEVPNQGVSPTYPLRARALTELIVMSERTNLQKLEQILANE